MENPYSWSNERLVGEFAHACRRAGVSGSGVVVSFSTESDASKASYLRGVLNARLDGVTPPFSPGQIIQPKQSETKPSGNDWRRSNRARVLQDKLTVDKVYYLGKQKWLLNFREWNKSTADEERVMYEDGVEITWHPLNFDPNDFVAVEDVKIII